MATNKKFRGAKPTPRYRLMAAEPFKLAADVPAEFAVVPPQLSNWGNNEYGVCVTSEEAFAKAAYSIMLGLPELFISEPAVIEWAQKHGVLNGATLDEVLDAMRVDGLPAGGQFWIDGPAQGVDYSVETILKAAVSTGPVKIAIDADALPANAGDVQGWFSTAAKNFPNTDHCVALSGYGTAGFLYNKLGVPIPSGLSPSTFGYLLFTWSTIGFVSHGWLMGTCVEAWVRKPTTPGQAPVPPDPPTPPTPPGPPTPAVPVSVNFPGAAVQGNWFFGYSVPAMVLQGSTNPGNGNISYADDGRQRPMPPWLLAILAAACSFGPQFLPPPYNAILAAFCASMNEANKKTPCCK